LDHDTTEDSMTTSTDIVGLYEDNAGAVYLHREEHTWRLGPVTADMAGRFAADAAGWVAGDWEPNEDDGQVPTDLDGLTHIASWIPAGVLVEVNDHGERVAGFGGCRYIGHVLVDADAVRAFLADLDDPIERARHIGELIEQARQVQRWLAGLRALNVANAAANARQATIANQLGVTEGRVSQMVTEGRRLTLLLDHDPQRPMAAFDLPPDAERH
jgi:hypothetical protein